MAPHQRKQATIAGTHAIDVPPAGQEVMIDDADDMEAIRYDARVGEVFVNQGAVGRSQVHAHHPDQVFAF